MDEEEDNNEGNPSITNEVGENTEAAGPQGVTRAQWATIFALNALLIYLYAIWPQTADSDQHLKDPSIYIQAGQKRFEEAHTIDAFPRDSRLNAFLDVEWQYRQARVAGGTLSLEDQFRWGYSALQIALGKYPGSHYAMVRPLELLEETRESIRHLEMELTKQSEPLGIRIALETLKVDESVIAPYLEDYSIPTKSNYLLTTDLPNSIKKAIAELKVYPTEAELELASISAYTEVQKSIRTTLESTLKVHPSKVDYSLALAYLEVGRFDKAIPLLEKLQSLRYQYEQAKRLKGGSDQFDRQATLALGASAYLLQLKELQQVGWMLGKAHQMKGQIDESISSLDAYLESTRPMGLGGSIADREVRFHALKLLSSIHLDEVHRHEKLLNRLRGMLEQGEAYTKAQEKRQMHLKEALRRLNELYVPEYQVYGLNQEHLMLVEVCVKLGLSERALEYAKAFESPDPHLRNEMKLWEIQATLQKNPDAEVNSVLESIAGENTRDNLRLAAWVMLGDLQVDRGQIDMALGSLLPENAPQLYLAGMGAYEKAASMFSEAAFDENTMINKFKLIEAMMARAHKAEKEGDEDLAIRLYRFLLKEFTVKKGSVIHGIANLQRTKGQKILAKNKNMDRKLKEEAKHWFQVSAESYLETETNPDIPFEKATAEEALFQAAESYFEGGFYTKAYDTYGQFIETRSDDNRVTKARHKKGISALYRKNVKDPFGDARREFLINISNGLRPKQDNGELSLQKLNKSDKDSIISLAEKGFFDKVSMEDALKLLQGSGKNIPPEIVKEVYRQRDNIIEILNGNVAEKESALVQKINAAKDSSFLDEVLAQTEMGSRDIWAYNSMYELGMAYYAEHKYDEADKVFSRIRHDGRFTPASEVWRKTAYAQAQLAYDRVVEKGDLAPWPEVIPKLEDLLMLYDLKTFPMRFSMDDKELYKTFQRDNAHIKFLLAKALLKNKEAAKATVHVQELLGKPETFDLTIPEGSSEDSQMATEQKTQALLGDCLYYQGKYNEAMEQYRRAHDRNLDSAERPFYSLNIVDCLVGMGEKEDAINRLKRTKWEFDKFFKPDPILFKDKPNFDKQGWEDFVDLRLSQLL